MKEEKKNQNIIIIILAILLILCIGYISYDKLLRKDNSTNKKSEIPIQSSDNSKENNDNTVNSQNSYQKYSSNMKKIIQNWELRSFSVRDQEYNNISYKVILTNKLELIISFQDPQEEKKYGEIKIADNVIDFDIAQTGPGGYHNIYFIKEDGSVGEAIPWELFGDSKKTKIPVNYPIKGLKNIVSIINNSYQDLGYMQEPAFIDINGNVFDGVIETYWD